MSHQDFTDHLKQLLAQSPLSVSEVAQRAGISRSALYKLLDAQVKEAKLSTFINLAFALDTHPVELMRRYLADGQAGMCVGNNQQPELGKKRVAKKPKLSTGFVADVTIPDNSQILCGKTFVKTWRVMNTGSMPWQDLYFSCQDSHVIHQDGLSLGLIPQQSHIAIPLTLPGEMVELSVTFTAPDLPGSVISYWKTTNAAGEVLFPDYQPLHCLVKVVGL